MAITFNSQTGFTLKSKRGHASWLRAVASKRGRQIGELNYMFVSDEKILEVNRQFLGHDYYTDIITFPYDEGETVSADIYISLETVYTNAEKYAQKYYDELDRVIVHGLLHLIGNDDVTPELEQKMHQAEDEAISMKSQFFTIPE